MEMGFVKIGPEIKFAVNLNQNATSTFNLNSNF